MKPPKLWFLGLAAVVNLLLGTGQGAAQTKITACNTTISAAGSYLVTANLTTTSTSTPCIKVTAGFVTIDLSGFVLTGNGASSGISASAGPLTITNGFIKSFGVGVSAPAARVKLSEVTLLANKGAGASLGDNAAARDSKFINNGADGLDVGKSALITQCIFLGNSGNGLKARASAVLTENVASSNGSTIPTSAGFEIDGSASVSGNSASDNTAITDGFGDAGGGSTFEGNTASSNGAEGFATLGDGAFIGNCAVGNNDTGIDDGEGSTFEANTANFNGIDGLSTDAGANFVTNTADSNGNSSGFGINVFCPVNLVVNTAEDNDSGAFTNHGTSGCSETFNLGF
jgi:hypothetical protein